MWVLDEIEILIGGPQGSGIETSMMVLSRAFARRGYGVIADREYFSNITGRHSYIHMLVSANKIPSSLRYPVKILVGADAETVFTHFDDLAEKGVIIYDKKQLNKRLDEVPSIENATKNRISRKLAELGVHQDVASVIKYLEKERRVLPLGLDFEALLRSLLNAYKIDPRQLSRYVSGLVVSSIAVLTGLS
ncbi:MAG: 2-oxoacid:acceptor oxidoreductase family protein, partial [Zestosphaera sp.]